MFLKNHEFSGKYNSNAVIVEFFNKIYLWMFIGILISAFFSFLTLKTPLGGIVFSSPVIYYGFIGIELLILLGVQFAIHRIPVQFSKALFILYAVLNGITLSGIFVMYGARSIISIFLISAALFGALALYGYKTKKDLSGWGIALFIGMIGVFITSIINIFLKSNGLDFIVSIVAVFVFALLVAYDSQVFRNIAQRVPRSELDKYATLGALFMYVNFIMIFVNLLKLFGGRD